MEQFPERMLEDLRNAKSVTILTGAGVSAESEIPTFRGVQTGLWAKYDPSELATPEAFGRNPKLVWEWYEWRRGLIKAARPNPSHRAIVEIENNVNTFTLITQNVDGLHYDAGSQNIIELHGNITRTKCSADGEIVTRWLDNKEKPPKCLNCGSNLRPDVVWFGESLPQDSLTSAIEASQNSDIFLSIGTSSVVHPAASLPMYALRTGSRIVEINPAETPLSPHAHHVIRGYAGEILPDLVKQVWRNV